MVSWRTPTLGWKLRRPEKLKRRRPFVLAWRPPRRPLVMSRAPGCQNLRCALRPAIRRYALRMLSAAQVAEVWACSTLYPCSLR